MPYKKTLTRTRFKAVIRVLGNQICAKFSTLPREKQQHFFPNTADVARLKNFINFCGELLLKQLIHFNQIRWRIFVHLPSWWKLKNKLSFYLSMMRKLALRDRKKWFESFHSFSKFYFLLIISWIERVIPWRRKNGWCDVWPRILGALSKIRLQSLDRWSALSTMVSVIRVWIPSHLTIVSRSWQHDRHIRLQLERL